MKSLDAPNLQHNDDIDFPEWYIHFKLNTKFDQLNSNSIGKFNQSFRCVEFPL